MVLIPEEDFLRSHPEFHGLEGYDLMMKRLEDEAAQRVELETRRKELVNRRTSTQADNKKRKNDLDNLTETLKKFIEVTPGSGSKANFRVLRPYRRCFKSTSQTASYSYDCALEHTFENGSLTMIPLGDLHKAPYQTRYR